MPFSDLFLLFAMVKLNRSNKHSILLAMRVFSATGGKDQENFLYYLRELIQWGATDRNQVENIVRRFNNNN